LKSFRILESNRCKPDVLMGRAAAHGIDAFEKRKQVLSHLVTTSIAKFLFRLMPRPHLASAVCRSGAWRVSGTGFCQG